MSDDNELIAAARGGDDEAFQLLAARYMAFAHEKAKGFVNSPIEYDDIVQEAMIGFLSAYYSYDEYGGASFRTYVSVCMNNRIVSAIKALERKKCIPRSIIVGLDDLSADYADDGEDPEAIFFRRQKAQEVLKRLDELTGREKKVLSLFLGGKKYDEIARELSVTPKSVDNTIQRIRRKLRRDC